MRWKALVVSALPQPLNMPFTLTLNSSNLNAYSVLIVLGFASTSKALGAWKKHSTG